MPASVWLMLLQNENWRKKKWLIWSLCGVVLLVNHMKCFDKNVIRFSIFGGVITILRRLRRLVQMMALITVIAFMTLVLYQNVHGLKDLEVTSINQLHHIPTTPKIIINQLFFNIFIDFFVVFFFFQISNDINCHPPNRHWFYQILSMKRINKNPRMPVLRSHGKQLTMNLSEMIIKRLIWSPITS